MTFGVKKQHLRKSFLFLLILSIFSLMCLMRPRSSRENFENCWAEKDVNCGHSDSYELLTLPEVNNSLQEPFISFLEGHGNDHLSPRMFCAVESAALVHPDTPVYIFMTSGRLKLTPIAKRIMRAYDNVEFLYMNASKVLLESPLKEWFVARKWTSSLWPKSHFNDALRWIVLWRFGGVYLDLDVVVLRNLLTVENFVVMESKKWVGAGALRFSRGHPVINQCLSKFVLTFDGSVWGANGPQLLTKTLKSWCGLKIPSRKVQLCSDVKIYQPRTFYPIPWWNSKAYFESNEELSKSILVDPRVLGIHVWNLHTHALPAHLRESNPYAAAANGYCPLSVEEVGTVF